MDAPKTLQQAIIYFSDPQRAFDYAMKLRWPDGKVACPRCGGAKHSFIKTRRIWFCYDCKKQFSLKVGSIFEDSPLGLDKWMTAFWVLSNCKNGISSYELARTLGITQTSAWFVRQRVRLVMRDEFFGSKLGGDSGEIEVDESFIGGKARTCTLVSASGESLELERKTKPPSWASWNAAVKSAPRLCRTARSTRCKRKFAST
jgi:transposase-like protein